MQPITRIISRALLLSLFAAGFAIPAVFADPPTPVKGAGNPDVQSGAVDNSAFEYDVSQLQRLHNKFPAYMGAYKDTVNHVPTTDEGPSQDGTQMSAIGQDGPDQYRQKVAPDANPTRVAATGFILPSGFYIWDGRMGMVPNPTLAMPGYTTPMKVNDSGYIGPHNHMLDGVDMTHALRTTPITNAEYAMIQANAGVMRNEMQSQPDRWKESMRHVQEVKQSSQSNQIARGAESNTSAGWENVGLYLINVANENAWTPCGADDPFKSYSNAAWMVGQMYKQVYIPMAILLLLPGAILTQVKTLVRTGFLPDQSGGDEDMVNPFSGIMRAVIAVFLIPGTQLFVSYSIDVGNSLSYEVVHSPYYNLQIIEDWRNQQTYDTKTNTMLGYINGQVPEQGKTLDTPEDQAQWEAQNYMSSTGQAWFNTLNQLLGQGIITLNTFQVVIMEYLFLMGPVCAALYAWPSMTGETQGGFKTIFARWVDGVTLIAQWKFWWSVIILAMSVRLQIYESVQGGAVFTDDTFEMFMCTAFCSILLYVPFNPFDFQPGQAASHILDQGQQAVPKGGSGSAVGGGASPAGGSVSSGSANNGGGGGPAASGGGGAG